MAGLTKKKIDVVVKEAKLTTFSAPSTKLFDFGSKVLNLNVIQAGTLLDDSALMKIAAQLTEYRGKQLFDQGKIPDFVVHKPAGGGCEICGLGTFLGIRNFNTQIAERLKHRAEIRKTLRELEKGHFLEAVAAALLNSEMTKGYATQGARDQGIDAVGWSILFEMNEAIVEKDNQKVYSPDAKVFAFSSAKKSMSTSDRISLISPAAIRETIGGWVIQRSNFGAWKREGVKMLSPVQMIFATTYRISEASRILCKELGVQVWSLSELVYLIVVNAPENVFDPSSGYQFCKAEFDKWWMPFHHHRVVIK